MIKKIPLKPWDFPIIALAITAIFFSAYAVYARPQSNTGDPRDIRVLIQGAGLEWVFPLDAEETVVVQGPLGNTVVRIHANEAWVESSPCANQVCVAAGHIRKAGVWVACLPNSVFLLLEGNDEQSPDVVAW